MSDHQENLRRLIDDYGNIHDLQVELARGGQGVVYRTGDSDLAIKQPLDAEGRPNQKSNLRARFQSIRHLPLPARIQISLPIAILRDEPGYVMRLLNNMKPFSFFELNGTEKKKILNDIKNKTQELPKWLTGCDINAALILFHYMKTGSTQLRLTALSKCACILARLHASGLVYGDISPNNVFVGEGESPDVWLIDADNLRLEQAQGGSSVYTPCYGAPEIIQGKDHARPRSDCWAFAVMAFRALTLSHPFIGKKVLDPEDDEGGWDSDPVEEGAPVDLDEQAYAGYLPFIDDEYDTSNASCSLPPLPRELIATQRLRQLFQETFSPGRTEPHRRSSMAFWAIELARASDQSIRCLNCAMTYFVNNHSECPYCKTERSSFIRAKTPRWELIFSPNASDIILLPHRLFYSFSLQKNNDIECEGIVDLKNKSVKPVRGTKAFPLELSFEFVEENK